ncbi:MAG: polysaccharide biosynthesis/export family protein [Phycisphaerales bacterium]
MSQPASQTRQDVPPRRRFRGGSASLGIAAIIAALGGCNTYDSFMDPHVVGRWERTPTKVPILTHLAAIEDDDVQYVEVTSITASDLLPESEAYRVGAGDLLNLTIYDLEERGRPSQLQRAVDQNGYIEISLLGRIFVNGLTEAEVTDAIAKRMADIIRDPQVSVVVAQRRQQIFHLMGAVSQPGPYSIPASDYKLLQALVAAGGFPQYLDEVYVIRQVPLTPEAAGRIPEEPADIANRPLSEQPARPGTTDKEKDDLLDVIDDLSSPSVVSADGYPTVLPSQQPDPIIDLIPPADTGEPKDERSTVGDANAPAQGPRWIFRDGEWVRVQATAPNEPTPATAPPDPMAGAGELVTQRVIRVPLAPLIAGDARYNIVVRPGDVVRVPQPPAGNISIDGQVSRPGTYQLPAFGKLTLTRALTSAGGLSGLAIPERVDLTRMVGTDEQATIMLNLRAIEEGTQPDLYLKPNDRINVGTSFWATPLAVFRNGLRASYGFGFLLDRNFGNDVFGAPPTNSVGN